MGSGSYQRRLDGIRRTEYPQLNNTVYLDHAGTTLYANSLVDSFAADMKTSLFGNPHSACPSSKLSSDRVDQVRSMVLDYFKADPAQFDVVFVANATAAIKIVLQGFQNHKFWYGYTKDSHTSLVGVRELAQAGSVCFASDEEVDSWIRSNAAQPHGDDVLRLMSWPAQSNLSGYRPPVKRWLRDLRQSETFKTNKTYTLLDAASYLCTGALDLSDAETAPDFTALSFYKIFGFPDLGALIVRKAAGDILLTRPYFGGGTVDMVIGVDMAWHAMKTTSIHDVLEDGTLPFHNIVALQHAIDTHKRLYRSPLHISRHVAQLGEFAYEQLSQLKHYNGVRVAHVHKDVNATYGDTMTQGPIMAFSLCDSAGSWIGKSRIEKLGISCGLQFRTGGVCNPGGIATMLKLKPWHMRRNFSIGMTCGDDLDVLGEKPTGIVRISFGAMTSFADIEYFIRFVQEFFVEEKPIASLKHLAFGKEDASEKSLDSTPSAYEITPIAGLPPCSVIQEPSKPSQETYTACSVWDKEWCLVNSTSKEMCSLDFKNESENTLTVHLNPEKGTLTVTNWSETVEAPVESKSGVITSVAVPKSIAIDLWQISAPETPRKISVMNSEKCCSNGSAALMVYNDPEIQDFFSSITKTPCTLARFSDRHKTRVKKEGQKCVVWWCKQAFDSAEALEKHYSWHNTEWSKGTPIHGARSHWRSRIFSKLKSMSWKRGCGMC